MKKEIKPLTALQRRQELLAHHVRMVARKMSHALLITGAGGIGKTRTVLSTLDEEGITPFLLNSHVTPLSLFSILYQYRSDQVLVFDDVDSIFGSMPHLGLLRSALWGTPRIVTYNSTQLPSDLPSRFEFTSRCIFAANVLPMKNEAFKAVLSRCDIFELSATNGEIIETMRDIANNGFRHLTPDDCQSVIDFIEENADDRQLSLRLLGPSLSKFRYARYENLDWRPLVKSQLRTLGRKNAVTKRLDTQSVDKRHLVAAIEAHPDSAQDQQEYWSSRTKKSRASYFRCLARYKDEIGE